MRLQSARLRVGLSCEQRDACDEVGLPSPQLRCFCQNGVTRALGTCAAEGQDAAQPFSCPLDQVRRCVSSPARDLCDTACTVSVHWSSSLRMNAVRSPRSTRPNTSDESFTNRKQLRRRELPSFAARSLAESNKLPLAMTLAQCDDFWL